MNSRALQRELGAYELELHGMENIRHGNLAGVILIRGH